MKKALCLLCICMLLVGSVCAVWADDSPFVNTDSGAPLDSGPSPQGDDGEGGMGGGGGWPK
jgi:hypothetical protein